MAFMQLDDVFSPLSVDLSFTALWWELCDNICIHSKAATFLGFLPVPLEHKHFWNVARHIFVFILSHWKQFLQSRFFFKSFVPLKMTAISLGGIIQHTSNSEVKGRWDWSPHVLWLTATFAHLPNFSIWTDSLRKIQRLLFCVFYFASDWQHYSIYQFICFG